MNKPVSTAVTRRDFAPRRRARPANRRGAALLVALFVIFAVATATVSIFNSLTSEIAALRNALEYERALYLANAGVHAAAAELESDATWRGTVSEGTFPADDTYTATAVDGSNGSVTVTSRGAAGETIRTVVAVIDI
ncbi:MAG: hypothetical protein CMJ58_09585 [Planctomycetaceae bacterium]|nr:hypothetical protein [Planctomycetaceae bacterium]